MPAYTISAKLRSAIESLFDDPSTGFGPLGIDDDGASDRFETDVNTSLDPSERARLLKQRLEDFVIQMSNESEEIGCNETTDTLRMQSIGMLIALRELHRHFPD